MAAVTDVQVTQMLSDRVLPLETQFAALRAAVEEERTALQQLQGQHKAMQTHMARMEQEHNRYHLQVDEMESDVRNLKEAPEGGG